MPKLKDTKAVTREEIAAISSEIRHLQVQRAWHIKSRNMLSNRLTATIAGTMGYDNGMTESDRKKMFSDAKQLIKQISSGEVASNVHALVMTTVSSINGFDEMRKAHEKEMVKLARRLPVADWVEQDEQRGFGLLFLAIVVGECGDLANYANPAKVWRRMGCAPWRFGDKTLMGATWRSGREGKLPASEWEQFGYSPRRRSIAYLIGEGLVKQNASGPYRARYDDAKERAAETHPEWVRCKVCDGACKTKKGSACSNCKGSGKVMKRCHLHGMLLATKLLLKNLWIEWNK